VLATGRDTVHVMKLLTCCTAVDKHISHGSHASHGAQTLAVAVMLAG